jgi:hypothetical protein
MNDVEKAAETRCYLCERALGSSWCIVTDKQYKILTKPPNTVGEYLIGVDHRVHYTCAVEFLQKRRSPSGDR